MRGVWVVLLLVLCGSMFALGQRPARATYARNGTLIGLADLAPLRDCPVRAMEGKVRVVKDRDGVVSFDLESKSDRMTFQFPLNRLSLVERTGYEKDFLHKGLRLRANGYACGSGDGPFEAISVERAY